ncbi:sulfite exporter TauE/SafE family protein [Candidatus Uhrbacteria bacterium]|nr:sulfite exporter TauE/SafE family protein [Candidatus Uhrbacteria bacterium]
MNTTQTCEAVSRQAFWPRFWQALLAVALVWFVWKWMISPFLFLLPSATVGPSYAAMFILGLVASVSTCLASTGAFLVAFSGKDAMSVALTHAGRLVTFVIGGALLGGIGQGIALSAGMYGFVGIVLGLVLAGVALYLLDLLPRSLVSLPMAFGRFAHGVAGKHGKAIPPLVGAVTFLLPCGFTQAAQAMALASGSAQVGATMMGVFALGTFPVLVGLSLFGSIASMKSRTLQLATGGMLALFAVAQIDGGLTVLGSPVTFDRTLASVGGAFTVAPVQAEEQIVSMRVAYGAFSPNRFIIKRGVPVRWDIDGVDVSGCANSIVVPTLGITQSLVVGKNLIRFTPSRSGTIPFSCSMGMIRGSFQVVE